MENAPGEVEEAIVAVERCAEVVKQGRLNLFFHLDNHQTFKSTVCKHGEPQLVGQEHCNGLNRQQLEWFEREKKPVSKCMLWLLLK
jgi:hypothetical protein